MASDRLGSWTGLHHSLRAAPLTPMPTPIGTVFTPVIPIVIQAPAPTPVPAPIIGRCIFGFTC